MRHLKLFNESNSNFLKKDQVEQIFKKKIDWKFLHLVTDLCLEYEDEGYTLFYAIYTVDSYTNPIEIYDTRYKYRDMALEKDSFFEDYLVYSFILSYENSYHVDKMFDIIKKLDKDGSLQYFKVGQTVRVQIPIKHDQ